MLSWSSVAAQIRAGMLVPLAVTSANRLPYIPELPTLRELGLRVDVEAREYTIPGLIKAIVLAQST